MFTKSGFCRFENVIFLSYSDGALDSEMEGMFIVESRRFEDSSSFKETERIV